jgi:Protein of unknown function (DUF3105)
MADKPRVKAPKQRSAPRVEDPGRTRRLLMYGAGATLAVVAVVVLAALTLGGGKPSEDDARAALQNAGCTLKVADALPGEHSIEDPGGTSRTWNTDPPTSGPHYGIAAVFGAYAEELEIARVVHNLEHGGIFILYGGAVPEETVGELRTFYDAHQIGTVFAPLDKLNRQFALGAWVSDGEGGNAYLAKCRDYDENAVSTFFRAFQFQGPERFDPEQLQPGL